MVNRVVLVTGGFDPIHSGHIDYFREAKRLGDILVVGVNSDSWLRRKKGREFMPSHERVQIIENLKMVDHCILFNDAEDHAIEAISNVKTMYPNSEIIFANGGDRTQDNIPEMLESDVIFEFGVGGTIKKNSSSWILEEWKSPKTIRSWGYYRILYEVPGTKVKELTIEPGKTLTMQRHYDRDEHWHVAEGACTVDFEDSTTQSHIKLKRHDQFTIKAECWHKLHNPTDIPCKIVEIQYGITCVEEDIERR
jgi:D-beta-D-heptose 7-phosphate kinase/D-beta-D-heptose 1-phosphate adenosyltransferase